jgi:hypothetical protein
MDGRPLLAVSWPVFREAIVDDVVALDVLDNLRAVVCVVAVDRRCENLK